MLGFRRRATRTISLNTAPVRLVTTPTVRGSSGMDFLTEGSNSPSALSLALSASKRMNSSPAPSCVMASA